MKFLKTVTMGTERYYKAKPDVESIKTNKILLGSQLIAILLSHEKWAVPLHFLKNIKNTVTRFYQNTKIFGLLNFFSDKIYLFNKVIATALQT